MLLWAKSKRYRSRSLFLMIIGLLAAAITGRQLQIFLDSRPSAERGPYLQMLNADSVTIRWQTDKRYRGRVIYDDGEIIEPGATTDHAVRLTDLTASTHYRYQIGPDGPKYTFSTLPPIDEPDQSVRLWVLGDPGAETPMHLASREAGQEWLNRHQRTGRPLTDLWLTTGDNAYTSGRDSEYQAAIFSPYKEWLTCYSLLPAFGNHDARRRAFYRLFDFPAEGEMGGFESQSTHFFAIDQGPLHLIILDSQTAILNDRKAMLKWLEQDLTNNTRPWIIALFHHPPYSKGSHDSDDTTGSDRRMTYMRQYVLPVLEARNVDLVLSGHSHTYERSHLLSGHYGMSDTLSDEMIIQAGQGYNDVFIQAQDCRQNCGTVYQVLGSTAILRDGALDHPAMAIGLKQSGTLVLDVTAQCLISRFITSDGQLFDRFQLSRESTANCPIDDSE